MVNSHATGHCSQRLYLASYEQYKEEEYKVQHIVSIQLSLLCTYIVVIIKYYILVFVSCILCATVNMKATIQGI